MSGREPAAFELSEAWEMPSVAAEFADIGAEAGPIPNTGRRAAPRLRLSLPARLVAVERTHQCILMNLSRDGAQIAILESLREGEGAVLKCGKIDQFVLVKRSEFGVNALSFEEPISDDLVLHIRSYHENFEQRERRSLVETARKWVNGDTDDERAI